jgi:hypothetical protein
MRNTSKGDDYFSVSGGRPRRVANSAMGYVFMRSGNCNGAVGVPPNHDILFTELYSLGISLYGTQYLHSELCVASVNRCFADVDRFQAWASPKLASNLPIPNPRQDGIRRDSLDRPLIVQLTIGAQVFLSATVQLFNSLWSIVGCTS